LYIADRKKRHVFCDAKTTPHFTAADAGVNEVGESGDGQSPDNMLPL